MTEHLRYRDFFEAVILRQAVTGKSEIERLLGELLVRLQAKLAAAEPSQAAIDAEMALARRAAADLIARESKAAPAEPIVPASSSKRPSAAPSLVRSRSRTILKRGAFAIVGLILYSLPLILFLREGSVRSTSKPGDEEIAIALNIGIADLAHESVTFHILPNGGSLLKDNNQLAQDVTLEIDAGTGPLTHTFHANTVLAPWAVKAATASGDILDFPFDRYLVELDFEAKVDGKDVKAHSGIDHVAHGLSVTHSEQLADSGHITAFVGIRRSGAIVFVTLLSTLSLVLVTLTACLVAWQVYYRGRKVEFSMMVWTAALAFVIPTVRGSLPGNAPQGALIDFLVYFWLQIAIVVATSSLVWAWSRGPAVNDKDD